jgi:hypothetical protein
MKCRAVEVNMFYVSIIDSDLQRGRPLAGGESEREKTDKWQGRRWDNPLNLCES